MKELRKHEQENTQTISLRNLVGNKELQQTLVYTALMVGLKPERMEIEIAEKFVKLNYPNLTLENIIEAFTLNSSAKHWNIVEPYGSYNTMFIGKILTAYELFNTSKKLREQKALPPPVKNDLISHAEAKPMLEKLAAELKKMDLKFRINQKKNT